MAGPYNCDLCAERQAAVLLGNLEDGSQQFMCGPCFARFGLGIARGVLPPEEIAETIGPMFVGPLEPRPPAEERPRRARKSKAQPAPAEAGPPAPEEMAPDAAPAQNR